MSYYECKRCFYRCNQRSGIVRHLDKKNKCIKNIISYKYSDEELYNISLKIIKGNCNELEKNNKELTCYNCNKIFSTKGNLKKHCKKYCKEVSQNNTENVEYKKPENDVNNIIVNQQFNNCNFYNIKYPISFDNDWDLSKISNEKKIFLISFCDTKYSELLKYILQNDNNLNVIIENDTNTGIVYKNDIEKFINMDKTDIIDQSLFKLNQQLNILCKDISETMNNINDTSTLECINNDKILNMNDKIDNEIIIINKKYDDYKNNNNNIKSNVEDIIINIFNEKKTETINKMNEIINIENTSISNKMIGF